MNAAVHSREPFHPLSPLALVAMLLLLCFPIACTVTSRAVAQASAGSKEGCVPDDHGTFRCSFEPFRSRMAASRTLALETDPRDRMARAQLRRLTEALGKTVAQPDQSADLILVLKPLRSDGIHFGPADQPLGTLQVYAPDANGGHGALLWAETMNGQGDRPWASVAGALVDQLKGRLSKPAPAH